MSRDGDGGFGTSKMGISVAAYISDNLYMVLTRRWYPDLCRRHRDKCLICKANVSRRDRMRERIMRDPACAYVQVRKHDAGAGGRGTGGDACVSIYSLAHRSGKIT